LEQTIEINKLRQAVRAAESGPEPTQFNFALPELNTGIEFKRANVKSDTWTTFKGLHKKNASIQTSFPETFVPTAKDASTAMESSAHTKISSDPTNPYLAPADDAFYHADSPLTEPDLAPSESSPTIPASTEPNTHPAHSPPSIPDSDLAPAHSTSTDPSELFTSTPAQKLSSVEPSVYDLFSDEKGSSELL
jgi:hypothetical protein